MTSISSASIASPGFRIRQADKDDLANIVDWTIKLYQHEDDKTISPHKNFKNNLEHWIKQELSNSNSLFLLAEASGEPIGFIFATCVINDNGFLSKPMKGVIQLLWLDEYYRKQKMAKSLLEEMENCLTSIGVEYIECHYTCKNNLAKHFWDKNGYRQTSITAQKILTKES